MRSPLRSVYAFVSLLFCCVCVSADAAPSAPVRVVGSDLFGAVLGAEIQRFAKTGEFAVTTAFEGSRVGLENLQTRRADLGVMVFGEQDPRPEAEFANVTVGYLTAVIVAPATVSISQLHFGQLAGVFGASEQNHNRRWTDLGVTGPWAGRGISAFALPSAGLSLDLFRYRVMSTPELRPNVILLDDVASLYQRIESEEGGLGIVAVAPENRPKLKVLLVARGERDVAYGPTAENLHSGDYPLRIPVQFVFRKTDAKRLNFLLRHLLADETAPVLLRAGVVPLPVQARNQLVFELETL